MTLAVEYELPLPATWTGPAFVCDAAALRQAGGWQVVQSATVCALHALFAEHGIEATAWFCAVDHIEGTPPEVGLILAWDAHPSEEEQATAHDALGGPPAWARAGVRAIPRRAFPSLALCEGDLFQLWVPHLDGGTAHRLELHGRVLQVETDRADGPAATFLDDILHAWAIDERMATETEPSIDSLKLAFALHVSERIIEADGVIHDAELDFIARVFPTHRLDAHGLTHRATVLALRDRAGAELSEVLSHEERLALTGLFYAVCESDGHVHDKEVAVLEDAAHELGLELDEVRGYLADMW